MKKLIVLSALLLTFTIFAQQDVVAIVNGINITMDEWNREANVQKLLTELQNSNPTFYDVLTSSQEGLIVIERYRLKVLDQLMRKILFVQFAEKLNVSPDDKSVRTDVDTEIKKMLSDLKMTESQLNEYLVQFGMGTLEDYKQRLYFNRRYSLSVSNVYALYLKDTKVTDDEIKAYYDKNKDKYTTPAQYDLLAFKTKDRTVADSIRKDVVAGLSADEISKKYNISALVNGYINHNDTTKIPQSLWIYITSTIKGTTLPVQTTQGEFYVIRVRDVKVSSTRPLTEVSEEIRKELLTQKQEQITKKVLSDFDEFIKSSKIQILYKSSLK
ncbi:peptidyl-prolyl cis-trans isomerase [Fervidobacterium sp.]